MSQQNAVESAEQAAMYLIEQLVSISYPGALRVAAEFRIADKLADGPRSPQELADGSAIDSDKLYRVRRLLATREVFHEQDDGRFELTPRAEPLRSDVPLSVREAALMLTSRAIWSSVGELTHTIEGTKPPFEEIFGPHIWAYWSPDFDEEQELQAGRRAMTDPEIRAPLRAYDFPASGTVVDVGGGHGTLLLRILQRNPGLRGILYDRAHLLAASRLGELNDDDRWEMVVGDAFEAAPAGDLYALKEIVRDCDDDHAALVLRNCRAAMNRGGRVLTFDTVLRRDDDRQVGKLMDVLLMGVHPGRHRTEEEFRRLYAAAGLRLTRIVHTDSYVSIIEGVAA